MKRLVIEYENDIYWLYDSNEKTLLYYSDKVKELAEWLEKNIQNKKQYDLDTH
jgi:hypothetical protein